MTQTPFPRLDALARSLLRESVPRSAMAPLKFTGGPAAAGLESPGERAAAAVGALLVWKLVQHGGSCLPVCAAAQAAEHILETFPETDRHRLEKEAVEILRWLEDSFNLLGDEWKQGT